MSFTATSLKPWKPSKPAGPIPSPWFKFRPKSNRMPKYSLLKLRHNQTEAEAITEINIIPVIDISLVLLVILFVTAPLLSYPNLPIELPKALGVEDQGKAIHVTCTAETRLAVGARDVDWESLEAAVASEV